MRDTHGNKHGLQSNHISAYIEKECLRSTPTPCGYFWGQITHLSHLRCTYPIFPQLPLMPILSHANAWRNQYSAVRGVSVFYKAWYYSFTLSSKRPLVVGLPILLPFARIQWFYFPFYFHADVLNIATLCADSLWFCAEYPFNHACALTHGLNASPCASVVYSVISLAPCPHSQYRQLAKMRGKVVDSPHINHGGITFL